MTEKQVKQAGSKVIFVEEESVLKEWENMHRPPGPDQAIHQSGPGQAVGLVPTHGDKDRRCSIISVNQTKPITHFPLKTKKSEGYRLGDIRRPSDLWQGTVLLH